MGDAAAAVALGDALEQFANLIEQHYEYRLCELRLGAREETYAQRACGCDGHEEVLVQRLAVCKTLNSLFEGVPTCHQIRDQENQQQLPGLEGKCLFYDYGGDEKDCRYRNADYAFLQPAFVLMLVMMMMFVCHTSLLLLLQR